MKNLKFAIEQMLLTEGTGEKIISNEINDEEKRNILRGAILQVSFSLRPFLSTSHTIIDEQRRSRTMRIKITKVSQSWESLYTMDK